MYLPQLLSEPGPLLTYLSKLRALDAGKADAAIDAVRVVLGTIEGVILLDLLEKSTQLLQTPIYADDRALLARNAQGFIASDLRRILSDETEQLLEQRADLANARRGNTRRNPSRNAD